MKRFALVFFSLVLTMSSYAQSNQKRIALVIGNAAYQHGGKLRNPVNDANLLAKTLESLGFSVTKKTDANLRTMQIAAAEFKQKIRHNDVALFFYAGHGIQIDGINYLIPVDAKMDNRDMAKYDAFSIKDINDAFMANSKNVNIMILDACRNDPFRSWTRGGERGFTKIENSSKGTIIAFATQPGATADDGSGSNGLYTSKLVQQMKKPQSIEKVFKMTRIEVNEASNGQQVPQDWSSLMTDFYFTKQGAGSTNQNTTIENKKPQTNNKPDDLPKYLTDSRDGKRYKIVDIEGQIWMSENLAFNAGEGCWAYNNNPRNVSKYGYLYNWETAIKVCPTGWRLPNREDLATLLSNYEEDGHDRKLFYEALKPGGISGFSATLSGSYVGKTGKFFGIGETANFWSSSIKEKKSPMFLYVYKNPDLASYSYSTNWKGGFSVRCVKGSKESNLDDRVRLGEQGNKAFIENYINERIEEWIRKGEFETSDEYKKRVNYYTRKNKVKQWKNETLDRLARVLGIRIKHVVYDADNKVFKIEFESLCRLFLHIPTRDEAFSFKKNLKNIEFISPKYYLNREGVLVIKEVSIQNKTSNKTYTYFYNINTPVTFKNFKIKDEIDEIKLDLVEIPK